jgi:POT family proton-dependent oligopeptide transporter
VGRLYAPADQRRDQAFLWFNLGINIGAFAGPLVCGFLGQDGGWHVGFACAGWACWWAWRSMSPVGATCRPMALPAGLPRRLRATRAPAGTGRIGPLLGLIALSLFYNIPVGRASTSIPCGSTMPPTATSWGWRCRWPGIWPATG